MEEMEVKEVKESTKMPNLRYKKINFVIKLNTADGVF